MPELAPIRIETTESNDLRSYHVSSEKIKRRLGWAPKRSVEDAIVDLCRAFREGKLPHSLTDTRYFNVKRLQEIGLT
jgi:nucleoside-diphosphate-sugar epimerase